MSNKEPVDRAFIFDVIKVVVGIIIFLIIQIMLNVWATGRLSELNSEFPGSNLFYVIPFIIGLFVFAAAIFLEGIGPVVGALIRSARNEERASLR